MDIREIVNRNALTTIFLTQGWSVFLPVIDAGIDIVLYSEGSGTTRLIQQKSRWTIDRKYLGRNIEIAFPNREQWYVVPHDQMLDWPEVRRFLDTDSWTVRGHYHTARPPKALLSRLSPFALTPPDAPAIR